MPTISSPTPDATSGSKGKVQLAGDLAGTAASPNVRKMTDVNGNALVLTSTTASAVNQITVANASSLSSPSISATGTDTNLSINMVPKGGGFLLENNIRVATANNSLTLTNKVLSTGVTFDNNLVPASALSVTAIKLGYSQITSNFTLASTTNNVYADATGLSSTVTVPAGGRDVYITFKGTVRSSAGSGQGVGVAISEGSTVLDSMNWDLATSGFGVNATFTARVSAPSAGTHTYKIQVGHTATAALSILAGTPSTPSAYGAAYILVEVR